MAVIQWRIQTCCYRLSQKIKSKWSILKLSLRSLFYNEFADKYYIGDTCMEPMFWVVDHFTKILGPACVAGVLILMTSMIIIAYVIGLPFWWRKGFLPTVVAVTIGHWILINVVFNYYMAYFTSPGHPPQGALIPEAVSVCKKCIAPKPPRTHHCSVCNVCVLKMDHHCPWLNNCIGHFNHRYFFVFCIYVWIGIMFIIVFGIPVAWEHFMVGLEPINSTLIIGENGTYASNAIELQGLASNSTMQKRTWSEALYHSCIVYAALLCIAVFVAVGAVLAWHSRLISRGETSIESHINKREFQRLASEGKVFKNPYDFGPKKNWLIFFGIYNERSWLHIAFPSKHSPEGNGLQWHTDESIKWPGDLKGYKLKI